MRSTRKGKELYVPNGKRRGKDGLRGAWVGNLGNRAYEWALPPLAVREIQCADSSDPYEHQNGGEQDDYDQGSLLVMLKEEQLHRQALTALFISDLRFQ
jgi:hypothetical protein